jgi:hypothetical protein
MRRYAPLVAATALFVIAGGMALASDSSDVITACVKPSGAMMIVDDLADCGAKEGTLTWNTQGIQGEPGPEGPEGPEGPPGADGHLTCDDERRINAAAPAFQIREECGLITVASGLTEDGSASTGGSNFVDSAPFGNPPGDHDVAFRFEVSSDVDVSLEYLDLAVEHENGAAPLEVYLVAEKPSTNPNLSSLPDMDNVLEQWEVPSHQLVITGWRMFSVVGPTLEAHRRYWVVLSVTEENSRYRWWGGVEPMPGSAIAERYDFAVHSWPPGSWIGSDITGGSAGMRVVGSPG